MYGGAVWVLDREPSSVNARRPIESMLIVGVQSSNSVAVPCHDYTVQCYEYSVGGSIVLATRAPTVVPLGVTTKLVVVPQTLT